jgi:aerobic carbon-monoxide dehydrogenase medium subunit
MYASSFDYHRPTTLAEAVRLLGQVKEAKLLAGGHSLLPAMKLRLSAPPALVDISGLEELRGIQASGAALAIGALTPHATVAASELVRKGCPVLAETASCIGDLQVRNRGTIGGSVAHADPAADYPTVLLALAATLVAEGPKGRREIAASAFFLDLFTTALQPGEIVVQVMVPTYGKGTGGAYLKHRHPASSYAVVGVAALVEVKDGTCAKVGLAVGGATTHAVRASAAEAALVGQPLRDASFSAAAGRVKESLESPLSDTYASGEYRTHLAGVLARRALAAAAGRA